MFNNRFQTGLPNVLTSCCSIAVLVSILMLASIPAAWAQAQPTKSTDEQIAEPLPEGSGQAIPIQEIDEARPELNVLKQELESVRKENADLATRLEKQQEAKLESARELESSRSELADLVGQLETARKEISDLDTHLEEHQAANQRMSEELEDARAELATAQRQLEANLNEKEKLSAHLAQVQEDLDATRTLAGTKEQTVQTLRKELAQLAQANQKQAREIEALQTTAGDQKENLVSASREIAALEANIAGANRERRRLESQLGTLQQEMESLRLDKQRVQQSAADFQARHDALQAELPETEGGTASEAQLRDAGSEALSRLREQARKLRVRPGDPAAKKAYREAVMNLAKRQLRLAQATHARGLYRVRTKDTLALVAKRNYGKSGQWMQIFKANRHILDDPNRLMPDITLLIP